ncbi:MAG: aminotransferase class I/II-fold pyridoxal phosphate-dependent enzyme, partial [Acidimicrobiia bacterium]
GTFYLWVRSPEDDDYAFAMSLAERGVLVLPGSASEGPGYFRISLTATRDMIERSLPVFAEALE